MTLTTDSMVASNSLGVCTRSLSVTFASAAGPVRAVDSVSLTIGAGQFVALLGPSGCGKSTLLRAVATLQKPTSGDVTLTSAAAGATGGAALDTRHDLAFVFQDAHLLPWRSVLRNVALPLELIGTPKAERLAAAQAALEQVGLADAASRYPAQLSGGMRMRASLARALITNPKLLLLDEPFAALDEITRHRLDETLRDLWLRRRMTTLFVTHSIPEAVFLSERAIVFSRRPARIILDHTLALPAQRTAAIRTELAFAQESRKLYDALTTAEGSSGPPV